MFTAMEEQDPAEASVWLTRSKARERQKKTFNERQRAKRGTPGRQTGTEHATFWGSPEKLCPQRTLQEGAMLAMAITTHQYKGSAELQEGREMSGQRPT